ncbi:MAG TPA: polyhydroxyalkanoate synthesis regulator DNA-binding domain-containing protein, partial [Gemmatirosa sp.]|nr:polyhydroxyalkanoate synthesis regulator DNA-binding domain-containing protein [Gemmatirosa sp.]
MTEPTLDPIAEHASDDAEPRLVRRYGNRKLYDVRTSAYVSLEQLAELVRGGETLRVVDTATGEDITAQTLTQVILDEGKRGRSLLPTELLHSALRRSAHVLDAGLGAARSGLDTLRHGVDDVAQGTLGRLSRALPALPGLPVARADDVEALRRQVEQLERTLTTLVAAQQGAPAQQPAPPAADAPAADTPAAAAASTP